MGEGSVLIACIMQSFHKFLVFLFCPIPPPMRAALCKLLVDALHICLVCDAFVFIIFKNIFIHGKKLYLLNLALVVGRNDQK